MNPFRQRHRSGWRLLLGAFCVWVGIKYGGAEEIQFVNTAADLGLNFTAHVGFKVKQPVRSFAHTVINPFKNSLLKSIYSGALDPAKTLFTWKPT